MSRSRVIENATSSGLLMKDVFFVFNEDICAGQCCAFIYTPWLSDSITTRLRAKMQRFEWKRELLIDFFFIRSMFSRTSKLNAQRQLSGMFCLCYICLSYLIEFFKKIAIWHSHVFFERFFLFSFDVVWTYRIGEWDKDSLTFRFRQIRMEFCVDNRQQLS